MSDAEAVRVFEQARPNLLGLAYRILGSRADAEDAVQDTFVKWAGAAHGEIREPAAWLTTACTRRCLDLLRAAHRARVSYVGAWLPEPIQTPVDDDPGARMDLASSLKMAFLVMLERLTPRERAAYLLHEIFELGYPEIAATLDMQESACRKLVSRAKGNIQQARVRHATPRARQEQLLSAFQSAISAGDPAPLAGLLSDEVRLSADGGGKVATIDRVLVGPSEVLAFLTGPLRGYWSDYRWLPAEVNGERGLLIQQHGRTVAVASFAYDGDGRATDIFIVRNPDKLADLSPVAIQ